MKVSGIDVDAGTLDRMIEEELEAHRVIVERVKRHADTLLRDVFGIDPDELRMRDPSTYYAIIMEIARSVFVNISVRLRGRQRGGR